MSRKYRQDGYQDYDRETDRRAPKRESTFRDGPRSPRMMGVEKVVRCSNCGAKIPQAALDDIELQSTCPKCGAYLHTCKHCAYFDPSQRFECTQPITKRIERKDLPAKCDFFEIRTTVEKITSSSKNSPQSAKEAFEDLFNF